METRDTNNTEALLPKQKNETANNDGVRNITVWDPYLHIDRTKSQNGQAKIEKPLVFEIYSLESF